MKSITLQQAVLALFSLLGVFCFIPYFLEWRFRHNVDPNHPVNRLIVTYVNISLMSISGYMVLEATLDWYTLHFPWKLTLPRWIMILSVFASSLVFAIESNDSAEMKLLLFVCCKYARGCFLGIPLLFKMMDGGDFKFFHYTRHYMIVLLCLVSLILYLFYPFGKLGSLDIVTPYLVMIVMLVALFVCANGILRGLSIPANRYKSSYEKYQTLYYFIMGLYIFSSAGIALSFGNKDWSKVDESEITSYVILDIAILSMVYTIPTRMAQHDAVTTKLLRQHAPEEYCSRRPSSSVDTVEPFATTVGGESGSAEGSQNSWLSILEDASDACHIAVNILNDLLLFDRIEDGSMVLEKRSMVVRPLLLQCIKLFDIQAQSEGVVLRYNSPRLIPLNLDEVVLDVDVNKFSQVIRNLVSNAIKFTPRGGMVTVVATLVNAPRPSSSSSSILGDTSSRYSDTKEDEKRLRIEVHDTGCGISKENQEKLFQGIVQFNTASLHGESGTGLGLWLSHAIVESHGGSMGVKSCGAIDQGSIFHVELPVQSISPCDKPMEDTSQQHQNPSMGRFFELSPTHERCFELDLNTQRSRADSSSRRSQLKSQQRALVVDDSPLSRKMIRVIVSKIFDAVDEACDGKEAVERVKVAQDNSEPYDMIFMDQVMPNMTGIEATRIIRGMGYSGVVIAVTGNVLQDDTVDIISAGTDEVVAKPLRISELEKLIKRYSAPMIPGNMSPRSEIVPRILSPRSSAIHPRLNDIHGSDESLV